MELSENKKWEFFDSGFCTGVQNMEIDLRLVEKCRSEGVSFLRFYRWKPYAISLGYNQNKAANALYISYKNCEADNIDVVTRPTGGRAVLHSEELTYSVVLSSDQPVHELYRDISYAIINGLKLLGPEFEALTFTKDNPDLLKLIKTGMYNLCFNSAIKNEINYRGKKLVGSAQRKFGNIVLQHGSILIGSHHKNIVKYLNITEDKRKSMRSEIEAKTTCLNDIAGYNIGYENVSHSVYEGFKNTYEIDLKHINMIDAYASELTGQELFLN